MNKNPLNIFVLNFISLTFISSIVTQTTNLSNESNNKQQVTYSDQYTPKITYLPTANLLSSINFKNSSTESKAFPITNTNELWRLLSKLRIGSFFTSRARSIACECPTSSQQTTLIPIPVDIHHHFDKLSNHLNSALSNQPLNNPLNHPLNRMQRPHDLRSNTFDVKLTDTYPFMKKQAYNNEKYAYNSLNNLFLYPDKASSTEQPTTNENQDKTNLNDLISDNGRSISSPVRTSLSFNNQQQQTNPFTNLQDAFLFNKIHDNQINKNHKMQDNSLFSSKDELSHTGWTDNLNSLSGSDKQFSKDFRDFEGRVDSQQKDDLNPTKILNEIVQLLLNEMEANYSKRDLSKIRILKLLGDLEHFMKQSGKQWSTILPTNKNGRFSAPSSRSKDDFLSNSFASNLMNKLALNETSHSSGISKKSTLLKNKMNRFNDNDWNEEDEYFIDYHLPSESILNFSPNQTDFLPIMNPDKFFKSLKYKKQNQTISKEPAFDESKKNKKLIKNKNLSGI